MKARYKGIITFVLVLFMILNMGQGVFAEETNYIEKKGVKLLDLGTSSVEGKVRLTGFTDNEKIKVLIKKDEVKRWLDVKLSDGSFEEEIWLIDGTGEYSISIMVHKEDRKYTYGPTVKINNTVEVNKYIVPTKDVESDNEEIISLAKEITEDMDTDLEKTKAIYDWVVENINYDYDKYSEHTNGNYENKYGALNTFVTKEGVCYDYATLTAALGRAIDLQVKVVKGQGITTNYNGFHAWNEVYISENDEWINVDTTFGATSSKDYFNNSDFLKEHIKTGEY